MPFTQYQSSFDLDTLNILQSAFDQAWAEVAASSRLNIDEEAARNMIAHRIVAAWRDHGERNPEQLKRHAIEAF